MCWQTLTMSQCNIAMSARIILHLAGLWKKIYSASKELTASVLHSFTCCLTFCSADKLCVSETRTNTQTVNSCDRHTDSSEDKQHSIQTDASVHSNSCYHQTSGSCTSEDSLRCRQHDRTDWRPLLLIIPMRLGLTDINPIYFDAVKVCSSYFYGSNSLIASAHVLWWAIHWKIRKYRNI